MGCVFVYESSKGKKAGLCETEHIGESAVTLVEHDQFTEEKLKRLTVPFEKLLQGDVLVFLFFVAFYGLTFYAVLFIAYPRAGTVRGKGCPHMHSWRRMIFGCSRRVFATVEA